MRHSSDDSHNQEDHHKDKSMKWDVAKHTFRCLIGCNTGDAIGVGAGLALGWGLALTTGVGVALAFVLGWTFTIVPLLRKMSLKQATRAAIVGDSASVASMEFAEISVALFVIPSFFAAGFFQPVFWLGLAIILPIGYFAAYPAMYWGMKKEMDRQKREGKKASHH